MMLAHGFPNDEATGGAGETLTGAQFLQLTPQAQHGGQQVAPLLGQSVVFAPSPANGLPATPFIYVVNLFKCQLLAPTIETDIWFTMYSNHIIFWEISYFAVKLNQNPIVHLTLE